MATAPGCLGTPHLTAHLTDNPPFPLPPRSPLSSQARRRRAAGSGPAPTIPDDAPEHTDRDLTRDEEKSRSSNGFCRHFLWRSRREQAAWVAMTAAACVSAPRLAYSALTLNFHSAGLLAQQLRWSKKPKKH